MLGFPPELLDYVFALLVIDRPFHGHHQPGIEPQFQSELLSSLNYFTCFFSPVHRFPPFGKLIDSKLCISAVSAS